MKKNLKGLGNFGKELGKSVIFLGILPARKMAQAVTILSSYSRLSRLGPPIKTKDLTIFFGALWPAILTVYLLIANDVARETSFMEEFLFWPVYYGQQKLYHYLLPLSYNRFRNIIISKSCRLGKFWLRKGN